jgi:preprotein translocase subunit SecE
MNEQVREREAGSGGILLWVAIALVLAGLVGYYLLGDQPGWIRWLTVAAGVALGIGVFAASSGGRGFWQFAIDARNELRKVFWPGRNETWVTTAFVFGFAVVAGFCFWLLDLFLAWATKLLTGQGG